MFIVEKQECYLKGIEPKEGGTFTTQDGRKVEYGPKIVVTISIKDKNGKYMDLATTVPNTTDGKALVDRLNKAVQLMTKFYATCEVQFSGQNGQNAKVFLTDFSVIK